MVDAVLQKPEGSKIMILSPIVRGRKGEYKQLFSDLVKDGLSEPESMVRSVICQILLILL